MRFKILSVLILLVLTGICLADSPVALTLRMRGDIILLRADTESKLREGLPLINQDILDSQDDSFAFLKFIDDGATLRLFANSILTINAEKEDEQLHKSSFLRLGNVFINVQRRKGRYDIETPTTVASVKGTEGFIESEEDGTTYIVVLKGEFEAENTISGKKADVPAGFTCLSTTTGELSVYETEEIDEEWLQAIEDMPYNESDLLKIELLDEDGESRIIEIELE